MITFLGVYRGAAVYEVDYLGSNEESKQETTVIAKAMIPEPENEKIDFSEQASTQEKALKQIKIAIDAYLNERDMDRFVIDIF